MAQWADASYDSLFVTIHNFGGRSEFFHSVYEGKLNGYYLAYCKIFQIAVFLSAFFYCMIRLKKRKECISVDRLQDGFLVDIGFIALLGGFLFHIMWEGSSRYVYIYTLLLMPYAACGMKYIVEQFLNLIYYKKVLDRKEKV